MMRALAAVMQENGVAEPADITPALLDAAVDRIRAQGGDHDASVPFSFDTHAMIYSDEAPALEGALHREFADRRINMSNFRKEFLRVKIEEVEKAVARLAPSAAFFKDREAQEWHETLAHRNQALQDMAAPERDALPASF